MAAAILSIIPSEPRAESLRCPSLRISFLADSNFHGASFDAYLADDASERSAGLMGFGSFPKHQAMLFDFTREREVGFWMKNTLIPLDMIFLSREGKIVKIHGNAIPHDETTIRSPFPVRYVLEINGGLSRQLGLTEGLQARSADLPEKYSAGRFCLNQ